MSVSSPSWIDDGEVDARAERFRSSPEEMESDMVEVRDMLDLLRLEVVLNMSELLPLRPDILPAPKRFRLIASRFSREGLRRCVAEGVVGHEGPARYL
jgi:hypothetical protein